MTGEAVERFEKIERDIKTLDEVVSEVAKLVVNLKSEVSEFRATLSGLSSEIGELLKVRREVLAGLKKEKGGK